MEEKRRQCVRHAERRYMRRQQICREYGTLEIETPRKDHPAKCVYCGNQSFYEWMYITRKELDEKRFYLYQLTEDGTLLIRIFDYYRSSSARQTMENSLTEQARFFLTYGQVKKLIRLYTYSDDDYAWCLKKTAGYPYIKVIEGKTFPGWEQTVKESKLKYCPLDGAGRCGQKALPMALETKCGSSRCLNDIRK